MNDSDESILGLLLRAHGKCAAQAHGEEHVFKNIPAKCDYEMAVDSIAQAIRRVCLAEQRVRVHEAQNPKRAQG